MSRGSSRGFESTSVSSSLRRNATLSGTEVAFATQLGKTLRLSFAVIANAEKIHELACSSDDLTTEKTDAVCAAVLKSFRRNIEEGLPGE